MGRDDLLNKVKSLSEIAMDAIQDCDTCSAVNFMHDAEILVDAYEGDYGQDESLNCVKSCITSAKESFGMDWRNYEEN